MLKQCPICGREIVTGKELCALGNCPGLTLATSPGWKPNGSLDDYFKMEGARLALNRARRDFEWVTTPRQKCPSCGHRMRFVVIEPGRQKVIVCRHVLDTIQKHSFDDESIAQDAARAVGSRLTGVEVEVVE